MVTAANRGVGRTIALGLARWSTRVGMICRDRHSGETARAERSNTQTERGVSFIYKWKLTPRKYASQRLTDFGFTVKLRGLNHAKIQILRSTKSLPGGKPRTAGIFIP
jgi:NAD(P)-dependent dehydrogenase (short-subunit alcohol dehydrogenase family)